MILVSGGTVSRKRFYKERPDRIGVLWTPRSMPDPDDCYLACDNDCFRGFVPEVFKRYIERLTSYDRKPKWVTCPDVVADMDATLDLFFAWSGIMINAGLPIAIVAQDGLERSHSFDLFANIITDVSCVFIGGSTKWKMSQHAARVIKYAKANGKYVHVGRVNTMNRVRHFLHLDVDSIDGTCFSMYGDTKIPQGIKWIDDWIKESKEPSLFDRLES